MTIRTTKETITFCEPFILGDFAEVLLAGSYIVETDAELLLGVSFSAYRRTTVRFRIPAKSGNPNLTRVLTIPPSVLDAALDRERWSGKDAVTRANDSSASPANYSGEDGMARPVDPG